MHSRILTEYEFYNLKKSTLGERLRFFREEVRKLSPNKEFTTKAMGERLGITPQTITAIERGNSKNPSYYVIHKLTHDLQIPFDALTDEFYQSNFKSIPIGNSEKKTFGTHPNAQKSKASRLGTMIYQLFDDGQMRILHDIHTDHALEKNEFTSSLGRIISEIDTYKDEISRLSHPLVRAISLYLAPEQHPDQFPLVSRTSFVKEINALYDNPHSMEDEQ
ncbi:hypothetical protein PAE9249_03878 [Paenibacillus sp. CECT 9249]|uniref:helix-turn-helix transcriptional regulator n=1 Tax=Paenibacillus sp. CECT 9249 TaxID=2845385 RepID=UPI001E45F3EF|nr:helix-turn-helix domain-containing protein [Paenibacillus sp. CECT 9249]CAH0121351.1 hypothetical protein PAE9249_03878 [Paenibacillus sp. CECT 9249]